MNLATLFSVGERFFIERSKNMVRRKDSKGRVLEKGESQRKDGSYMFRYTDSLGERRTIYSRDLSALREEEKSIRHDIEDGIDTNLANRRTLNEQFQIFIKLNSFLEITTLAGYKAFWNKYIKDSSLGHKSLNRIKKSDGLILVNYLIDEGLAHSTIRKDFGIVKCCLDSAVDDDIIRHNPFNGIQLPESDRSERIALSEDQSELFLSFLKESKCYSRYFPMFVFMLETGVRVSELCGLTWADVDLRNKKVRIDHQLTYLRVNGEKSKFYVHSTKTQSGVRTIPLTWKAVEALSEQRMYQFRNGIHSCVEADGHKDFVFTTLNGRPFTRQGIDAALKNITKRMNRDIPDCNFPDISAHILRHTTCTRMVEAKMELKAIQKILGHKDVSTTLNVYTHITSEKIASEMEKFESIAL